MTTTRKKMGRPLNPKWREWDAKLGTLPDRVIAKHMGITQPSVYQRRVSLNIPAHRRHTK